LVPFEKPSQRNQRRKKRNNKTGKESDNASTQHKQQFVYQAKVQTPDENESKSKSAVNEDDNKITQIQEGQMKLQYWTPSSNK